MTMIPMMSDVLVLSGLLSSGWLMTTGPLTRPPQAAGCGRRDGRGSRVNDGQHVGGSRVTVACRVHRGRAAHVQRNAPASKNSEIEIV